jgi:hypothetical protein
MVPVIVTCIASAWAAGTAQKAVASAAVDSAIRWSVETMSLYLCFFSRGG